MSIAIRVGFGGAIPDYPTLVTRVAEWLDRDDLTGKVPVYVGLLEARLNRILRVPQMEVRALLTVRNGATQLPLDLLLIRHIHDGARSLSAITSTTPQSATTDYGAGRIAPFKYLLAGRTLRLFPPATTAITLTIDYYQRIPGLSQAAPINWLLEQHPDIYLYGTLMQATAELDDPDRISLWKAAHDEALGELQALGAVQRYGGAPLAPRVVSQVSGAPC